MSAIYDLNGEWNLIFDTSNTGVEQRWYANPPETELVSQVPQTWEKEFGKYSGCVAFYFKTITIDSTFNLKRTFLRFFGSSFHTTVWLNGKQLGINEGSYNSFMFNVAKAIKDDEENLLCVRVATMAANRIEGVPVLDLPVGSAYHDIPFGGMWKGVEMINGGKSCLLGLNVKTDSDTGKIDVEMKFSNPRNHNTRLLFVISYGKTVLCRLEKELKLEKEDSQIKVPLMLKEYELWGLDTPNLYKIEVFVDKSFSVEKAFGFRKIDIFRNELFVNDTAVRIQGLVYGCSHPIEGAMISDKKVIKKDLLAIKEAGFNVLRSGGAPMGKTALDLCDEIGLVVFQDLPIQSQRSSKDGLELARNNIEAIVTAQKTHPSIGVWVLGSDNGTLMLENGTKLLKHVDVFDDSRPVLSNLNNLFVSVEDELVGDTGKVMGVTNDKIILFNSHKVEPAGWLNEDEETLFANYLQEGTENAVTSKVGFAGNFAKTYQTVHNQTSNVKALLQVSFPGLAPDFASIPKKYTTAARNLSHGKRTNLLSKSWVAEVKKALSLSAFETEEELRENFNATQLKQVGTVIDSFMSSSQVSGYLLGRFRDSANKVQGFFDEFRRPKVDMQLWKRYSATNRILVTGLAYGQEMKAPLNFRLRLLNGSRLGEVTLKAQIIGSKGKATSTFEADFTSVGAIYNFEGVELKTPSTKGRCELKITVSQGKDVISEYRAPFAVVDEPKINSLIVWGDELSNADLLKSLGQKVPVALSKLSERSADELDEIIAKVEEGAQLLLIELSLKDIEVAARAGLIPRESEAIPSALGFHFLCDENAFPSFETKGVADVGYGALTPRVSIRLSHEADTYAAGIQVDPTEVVAYEDCFDVKLGKGKVIVNQYRFLSEIESSLQARSVLANWLKTI